MPNMKFNIAFPAIALGFVTLLMGCSTRTDTYQFSVQNSTDQPITIGLAKEGGPYQDVWASPEQAAIYTAPDEKPWGVIVDPGKTASAGPIKGAFSRGSRGMLRIYAGKPTISEILATGRDSLLRLDVPLHPGQNDFMIVHKEGRLAAVKPERPTEDSR